MARGPSALSTGRVCGRRGHVVRSGSGNTGVLAAINTPARRAGYIYRYIAGVRRAGCIYRYIEGVLGGQVTYTGK